MQRRKHVNRLLCDIRIIPVEGRDQTAVIFSAYSRAVQDLGGADPEVFGQRALDSKVKAGGCERG